ncbi:hypothetical protein BOTNAR_0428g00010 [Botryotinia narcissicola]|uniref:Zn(2)-C6 fungal-type domain-containing protein n=1 Tax=Botryotinia narcissicola TaxID=278944 RepID=A0A4Z1HLJ0_9HELO|nr:hypothetical protein BOTNAR_0428g00010 [Botryotinia narcissicola]
MPIYIGFGSIVMEDVAKMIEIILEAIRAMVFKNVSVVIHHGGAGTTACGLLNGRPTSIIPFFGDQPFWENMVAAAGADPRPIHFKALDSAKLTAAIRICQAPETVRATALIAARMKDERGVKETANSFHRNLPLDAMRCDLFGSQNAIWLWSRMAYQVKLSDRAAYISQLRRTATLDLQKVLLRGLWVSELNLELCKASHIKCDQGHPTCGSCRKKEKNCTCGVRRKDKSQASKPFLLPPTTSTASEQEREVSHISTTYSVASDPESTFSSQISIPPHPSRAETGASILWEDLELMHHFVTESYLTFSCKISIQNLWRTTIPKMASDHPFMMHGLLNISALHLAFLNPTKRDLYLALAIRHHDICLSLYRSELHSITPDNCSAMFICSILIYIGALAFPICSNNPSSSMPSDYSHLQQQQQLNSPIHLASSVFTLLQGAFTVLQISWHWLESSAISVLLQNRFQVCEVESSAKVCPHSSDSAFRLLLARIEAYNNAISTLRDVFVLLNSSKADNGVVLIWPFLLDGERGFITLLKEMRPLALLILAHYGVALHASRGDWFIGEWGRNLIFDVKKTLFLAGDEAELQELMAWPLEMVRTGEGPDRSDVNTKGSRGSEILSYEKESDG